MICYGYRPKPVSMSATLPPMAAGRPPHWSDEETADPQVADRRNFYKVERWTADDQHVAHLLYAGNSLDKARATFEAAVTRRPGGRFTIRQRARVIDKWPRG